MLLQFELCGQDVNAASYTFKLQQAMNFSTLKLKDVRIVCGNDKLQDHQDYAGNPQKHGDQTELTLQGRLRRALRHRTSVVASRSRRAPASRWPCEPCRCSALG